MDTWNDSESEKKKIKEREREYDNVLHWNLDAEYLLPLKAVSKILCK